MTQQSPAASLRVRGVTCTPVELPLRYVLGTSQALTRAEALARGRALETEGVAWLEEPIRHDDLAGNAEIARRLAMRLQLWTIPDRPGTGLAWDPSAVEKYRIQ